MHIRLGHCVMTFDNCIFIALLFSCIILSAEGVCQKPRIRKVWGELSLKEQAQYIRAITMAYENGLFDTMSEIHWHDLNFMYAHQTSGFFPWHRWFVWKMEEKIRAFGPDFECFTIPYWDWEFHNGDAYEATHVLNPHYFGTIGYKSSCVTDGFFVKWTPGGRCVMRSWNGNYTMVGQQALANLITSEKSYGIDARGFRAQFESAPHSNVHNYIGGNMGTKFSTYDPIFYLHHSNVDRLWSLWQDCHDYDRLPQEDIGYDQYAGTTPNYDGMDVPMPFGHAEIPEQVTPRSVYKIQGNTMVKMEYLYTETRFVNLIDRYYSGCNWDWFKPSTPTYMANEINSELDGDKGSCHKIISRANPVEVLEENEIDGSVHTRLNLEFGYDSHLRSDQIIGLRFSPKVPSGVTVFSTNIMFESDQFINSLVFFKIQVEDTHNSRPFGLSHGAISSRETGNKILWTINNAWLAKSNITTPDISPLIQNVIDKPDWSSGNSVGIILRGTQANSPNSRAVLSNPTSILLTISYCK